jgi:CheY-like chemotaxis protein
MAKILLIDDNIDMQKMLVIVLKKQGHEILTAERGQQGIDLAMAQPFGIIVLDVMMPDMNGYEVARRLRSEPATKDIPIIILTARAQAVDHQAAMDAGADAYLPKPVDIAELNSRINELTTAGRPKLAASPSQPATVAAASTSTQTAAPVASSAAAPAAAPQVNGRLISVASWRGGIGATTLAVNIAGILAREGRRVCLIDLSSASGHAALMLRLRAKPNWADLPADVSASTLSFSLLKHDSGLQLLAAPSQPQHEGMNPDMFNALLPMMFTFFTDIVVDCSPVPDAATRAALLAATRIVMPLAPEVTAVQTITGTLAVMAGLKVSPDAIRIVLNHPTATPTLLPARIENALKRPLDLTLPYDPSMSASLMQGAPLFMSNPKSPYITALAPFVAKL